MIMSDTERFYLAYLTEPREAGDSSPHSPQHLTLVPPFVSDAQTVVDAVHSVKDTFRQFPFKIAERVQIGPNQNVAVYTIRPVQILVALHKALLDELEHRGIDMSHLKYVRDEYVPHITIKPKHPTLQKGQRLVVDHIAVMQKAKEARTVLAKEHLEQ
ncbi:hypothetical protein COU91_00020 [Candidatus Saccharibacteria bacterium CG10_big_fil_rev_8_21_14_0_10_47_8]|nr:MAG: hypothetical protein COU91_00020 [Candidatus Saccharibacteria bacterium CG10_big_fil_rev_8_21_14_0_10_47_8]